MSTFTKLIADQADDDSMNLEIYRNGNFELLVSILLDDSFEVQVEADHSYSSSELKEIVEMAVAFAIRTTGVNLIVRQEDEERATSGQQNASEVQTE